MQISFSEICILLSRLRIKTNLFNSFYKEDSSTFKQFWTILDKRGRIEFQEKSSNVFINSGYCYKLYPVLFIFHLLNTSENFFIITFIHALNVLVFFSKFLC